MAAKSDQDELPSEAPSASSVPPRNAFTTLMSKRKASPSITPPRKKTTFDRRDGLGIYITSPAQHPLSRVVYHNADIVAIRDMYPKSSVHMLLLPRSQKHTFMHPFDAFADAEFLALIRPEAEKLKTLVAKELQRIYGKLSAQEKSRHEILDGVRELQEAENMPPGRDWSKEVRVGIHAHPSMNHLHIHVMSVDRYSECMKHRKHYNSFATPFFVPLEDFPLAEDDVRRHPSKEGYLKTELVCWRCGMRFGNHFSRLKEHLAEEFEAWKME